MYAPLHVVALQVVAGKLATLTDPPRAGLTLAQFRALYPGCDWTDRHWGNVLRIENWSPATANLGGGKLLRYWRPAGAPTSRRPPADGTHPHRRFRSGVPGPRTEVFVTVEGRMLFKRQGRFVEVDPAHRERTRARWRTTSVEYELTAPARLT